MVFHKRRCNPHALKPDLNKGRISFKRLPPLRLISPPPPKKKSRKNYSKPTSLNCSPLLLEPVHFLPECNSFVHLQRSPPGPSIIAHALFNKVLFHPCPLQLPPMCAPWSLSLALSPGATEEFVKMTYTRVMRSRRDLKP